MYSTHKTSQHTGLGLLLASLFFCMASLSHAQDFVWAPDFPVGSAIIDIAAQNQDGEVQTFDDLVGENGLLLMLSRSFDW